MDCHFEIQNMAHFRLSPFRSSQLRRHVRVGLGKSHETSQSCSFRYVHTDIIVIGLYSIICLSGECGLDDLWADGNESKFVTQQTIFKRQILLAKRIGKPLVLHIRGPSAAKAAKTIMRESELPKDWPIHMHCFTDSWKDCLDWSQEWTAMKFGFTPDHFLAEVARNLALDKILLETDAPYFFPNRVSKFASM